MTPRAPLRPLTRILKARESGENPDANRRDHLHRQHEAMRDRMHQGANARLLVLAVCFLAAFCIVGFRMSILAASKPEEPRVATSGPAILSTRADIVDRDGRVLATNLVTNSLYAHPHGIVDPAAAARGLARIFPDLEEEALLRRLTSGARFIWLRRYISPEQEQLVHDLGEPGLLFGPREMRLYPNGALASHILGGAGFGQEAVNAAEIIGVAGVEAWFDDTLRDPVRDGAPLALSIDLSVQAAVEQVLASVMVIMNVRGASAVLMDVHTGEIRAMASLPDFDPNARPLPIAEGDQADSPLFNRAVQGVYEFGSVFKVFTVAQALQEGLVNPATWIDTMEPLQINGFSISDFRSHGPRQSVTEVMVHSSNIGTARIARMIGAERQQHFLERLGFFRPTLVEMAEGPLARPLLPRRWGDLATMTISYGHGLSTSPLHLAAGYASVVNGGTLIRPTLLRQDGPQNGERIVSATVSRQIRGMLRAAVTEGTARLGDVPGYAVGGKTGSADKPRSTGGYYEDRVLSTFASVFPVHAPRYVLVVTLDEPEIVALGEVRRTAGWTAVPVAAEVIRRAAPLLGLRPEIAAYQVSAALE
ncbi:MAG: penicillin-binding protein 2 [Rhodobacteraceae bacterium]|nr:penicillin-binding protein 2 [Paracoccaceae bacterium]